MKYIFIILASIFLLGCGDDSSKKSSTQNEKTLSMEVNKTYTVFPGDSVKKDSEDAIISISKNSKETESYVTLTKGEAHIEFK